MSLTLNMVGGSGGGNLSNAYAVISVTYPSDGVCTCSDGVKTLRATGNSGFYVFAIPYAATWTVSVTNGVDTSSKSVVISSQYQVESVALSYTIYLFQNGAYEGIWEGKSWWSSNISTVTPSLTVGSTLYMTLNTNDYRGGTALNNKALDLNKNTLSYKWVANGSSGNYTIKPVVITPYSNGFTRAIEGGTITTGSGTGSMDISSLSSGTSYYFGVLLYVQGGTVNVTFSEVKLT